MPLYEVPVKWVMWGIHEIEASSPEEAMHFAEFTALPMMEEMVKDSCEVMKDRVKEIKNAPV